MEKSKFRTWLMETLQLEGYLPDEAERFWEQHKTILEYLRLYKITVKDE